GELLHQRRMLRSNEALQLRIEGSELWVRLDVVQRLVVAFVALVFPDVHCDCRQHCV
nr:hypothetical protein [Tanacetum cinerariifolium]